MTLQLTAASLQLKMCCRSLLFSTFVGFFRRSSAATSIVELVAVAMSELSTVMATLCSSAMRTIWYVGWTYKLACHVINSAVTARVLSLKQWEPSHAAACVKSLVASEYFAMAMTRITIEATNNQQCADREDAPDCSEKSWEMHPSWTKSVQNTIPSNKCVQRWAHDFVEVCRRTALFAWRQAWLNLSSLMRLAGIPRQESSLPQRRGRSSLCVPAVAVLFDCSAAIGK